jgi:uncharacterized protein (UPF0335 family)
MSEPTVGHNGQLQSIVERIENLNVQIKDLRGDQTDIFREAGSKGFDVKALRRCIAIRKMDAGKHEEFENIVDTYMIALGQA